MRAGGDEIDGQGGWLLLAGGAGRDGVTEAWVVLPDRPPLLPPKSMPSSVAPMMGGDAADEVEAALFAKSAKARRLCATIDPRPSAGESFVATLFDEGGPL